jgi:hypothetical protein
MGSLHQHHGKTWRIIYAKLEMFVLLKCSVRAVVMTMHFTVSHSHCSIFFLNKTSYEWMQRTIIVVWSLTVNFFDNFLQSWYHVFPDNFELHIPRDCNSDWWIVCSEINIFYILAGLVLWDAMRCINFVLGEVVPWNVVVRLGNSNACSYIGIEEICQY